MNQKQTLKEHHRASSTTHKINLRQTENRSPEIDFPMSEDGEDGLMTARNKWLIAHEDAKIEGAFNGLKGENVGID